MALLHIPKMLLELMHERPETFTDTLNV